MYLRTFEVGCSNHSTQQSFALLKFAISKIVITLFSEKLKKSEGFFVKYETFTSKSKSWGPFFANSPKDGT